MNILLHDGLGILHRQSRFHRARVSVCLLRIRSGLKIRARKTCPICFSKRKERVPLYPINPRRMASRLK